ncbi:glycoside hydrolase family 127 protein [Actomonas aquatica]|uniref:Glycoside hydrolase family 127 protein n=1 Tax=Actomonas aquatica TaxID=2866162 RepID=A0ABZ1C962_9BACT|nr:beta-L-arabinofuranosidase domain-containing protein [Opitutus sp. WL0086]WRQ88228.1 glycoside hydrolase family 127 protein [Opitutus sp. WL0086]
MMPRRFALTLLLASAPLAHAGENALIDTTQSPHVQFYLPDLDDVTWNGGLFGDRFDVCRDVMIPHMWDIFRDPHESHAWDNFLMAAGLGEGRGDGKPHGPSFNDGDFLKWFEALAQVYAVTKDPAIDARMDEMIAVIGAAQREDGYLHTHKIVPQRRGQTGAKAAEFEDREHFETYNMGHLITTACIHYRATGKTNLLELAIKAADYIDRLCQEVPEDLARNAICPSHYMGVVELYRITREPRYLQLAEQLIEIRSLVPPEIGSDHNQDRVPFREMTEAVGHAVRANYLYAGVADIVAENGDASLLDTLEKIDADVASQKLYVTGMTGALYDGASPDGSTKHSSIKLVHQAYGRDYQLPNLTAYNETCATIGYGMWMWRQFMVTGDAQDADLFEQTVYNGILPGISLEGRDYFYVNPLRKLHDFDWPMRWSRTRMPNIKSSFCCPPNVVRTIAELHNYVYSLSDDTVWVNLYAASTLDSQWTNGDAIKLRQETNYPWDGRIKIVIEAAPEHEVALKLRLPGWLKPEGTQIQINGSPVLAQFAPGTYADLPRKWQAGDTVELDFAFKPVLVEANPLVEETLNQVAVRYGPLVYCLEGDDLPEGVDLKDVALTLRSTAASPQIEPQTIAGAQVMTITLPGEHVQRPAWEPGQLYREVGAPTSEPIQLTFVPYYAWGNRGDTDMSVWVPLR